MTSISKAILWQEVRARAFYFCAFTLMQLCNILSFLHWDYSSLGTTRLLVVPFAFATATTVERVYQEHKRGTWLLLPVSRAHQAGLKLAVYATLLFVQILIGTTLLYALVRSNDSPGGPVPPLGDFVWASMAIQLGVSLVVLAFGWVACLQETLWLAVLWALSGLALAMGVHGQAALLENLIPTSSLTSGLHVLPVTILVALFGWLLVRKESESVGRASDLPVTVLRALGLTPLAAFALIGICRAMTLLDEPLEPLQWRTSALLTSGEVIVLEHLRGVGSTGHRRNGEEVDIPWSGPHENEGIASVFPMLREEDSSTDFDIGNDSTRAFLSRDRRHVSLFDRAYGSPTRGRQVGCWGADGISSGTSCTPFPGKILSLSQRYLSPFATATIPGPAGVRIVTSDRVLDGDLQGQLHERFHGRDIVNVVMISSEEQNVIFTRDRTYLTGENARECPAISPGMAAILTDGTLAVLHSPGAPRRLYEGFSSWSLVPTMTLCSTDGALREELWPDLPAKGFLPLRNSIKSCLLFPLYASTGLNAPATWLALLALRGIFFLCFSITWKKRGSLIALPGLALGPAYFLSAAFVLGDGPALVERVSKRVQRWMSSRAAHSSWEALGTEKR